MALQDLLNDLLGPDRFSTENRRRGAAAIPTSESRTIAQGDGARMDMVADNSPSARLVRSVLSRLLGPEVLNDEALRTRPEVVITGDDPNEAGVQDAARPVDVGQSEADVGRELVGRLLGQAQLSQSRDTLEPISEPNEVQRTGPVDDRAALDAILDRIFQNRTP